MTEQDSTAENNGMTIFRVIASMDEGTWISEVDSGYSINNNSLKLINEIILPNNFSLSQNYPNPFNATTLIKYTLPEKLRVAIKIFDVLGNQIKKLINKVQKAGYKSVNWDGKDNSGKLVSTGIYLYQMKSRDYSKAKIMILSK